MNRYATLMVILFLTCKSTAQAQEPVPPFSALVQPEAYSLTGETLYRPDLGKQKEKLQADCMSAKAQYDADPSNRENIIWFGRRAAYLWRYREAIELFSKGIELYPDDPRLYRHRGHRYITVRQFDKAVRDLGHAVRLVRDMADEVEPDGQSNEKNIPTSTLKSNIWYHLGLAFYLKGNFDRAAEAFRECLKYSGNDDMLCATSDWLYMSLRRSGQHSEAEEVLKAIPEDMNILENFSYHRRLLMYKGILPPDSLLPPGVLLSEPDLTTQGYGVANWYLYNGQRSRAEKLFHKVLSGSYWSAFGYIAAEAEKARRRKRP
ncbi:MAG: tetratricopeptide repeat protein [Ignavibacteriales bacterium]|nr:tetratricopeptide repeat protein [Ignavibacteriales bacterium]